MTSLQTKDLYLDDVCRIMALDTFSSDAITGIIIFKLNADATCSLVAGFGVPDEFKTTRQNISIALNLPGSVALRMNESLWVPNQKSMDEQFPLLATLPNETEYDSLYALPIRKFGAPIGAVVIMGNQLPMNESIKRYLELLGLMLATRFTNTGAYHEVFPANQASEKGGNGQSIKLTKREELIQIGMAKGFTNAQIAIELGYSESTIRQSAVELFSKLGVTNRVDAGKLLGDV